MMKPKQNVRTSILLLAAGVILPVVARGEPTVKVFVVEPAVSNHLVLPQAPLPPTCQAKKEMKISACRGEYEPASFVVTTDQPLRSVTVEIGQLEGSTGLLPAQAVDVRAVKLVYREFHDNPKHEGQAVPILLLHDDALFTIQKNPQYGAKEGDPGDPYFNVPRSPVKDAAELLPLRIEKLKQFWITVHVPNDAPAGTYRAPVQLRSEGSALAELVLEVNVLPFALLPSMLEYSLYYPAYLDTEDLPPHLAAHTTDWTGGGMGACLSARRYRLEMENMLAHGVDNPNIYYIGWHATSLDRLAAMVKIREQAGMKGKPLYLVGHPAIVEQRPLTDQERQTSAQAVQEIVTWASQHGYDEVYFMGGDEWSGDMLTDERSSIEAIHAGGGKVFKAGGRDLFDRQGDLLDLPILHSPVGNEVLSQFADMDPHDPEVLPRSLSRFQQAASIAHFQTPEYRREIDNFHAHGSKCYTYMNPMPSVFFPEIHRRNLGLGLWRAGFDGMMNWSYNHMVGTVTTQSWTWSYVWRTEDGVIDTLGWEALREGVDDVRYLTTLLSLVNRASGPHSQDPLVRETFQWLGEVDVQAGNLNQIRAEMARHIEALSVLGRK